MMYDELDIMERDDIMALFSGSLTCDLSPLPFASDQEAFERQNKKDIDNFMNERNCFRGYYYL